MNTTNAGLPSTAPDSNESTIPKGISRRTVVHGAAWSIPVIAAAASTPLAAASTLLELEFVNGPYEFERCDELAAVQVRATENGQSVVDGTMVTIVLPDGLEFTDGTTERAFPTSGGLATLDPIVATAEPGTLPLTATSGGASAASQATVTPIREVINWLMSDGLDRTYNEAPEGVSVAEIQTWGDGANNRSWLLSTDGALYFSANGSPWSHVTDGVTAVAITENGPNGAGAYVTGDGSVYWLDTAGTSTPYAPATLPGGAVPAEVQVWGDGNNNRTWVLSEDGTLYFSANRTGWQTVASDVTDIAMTNDGVYGSGAYVTGDGEVHWLTDQPVILPYAPATLPGGAVPAEVQVWGQGDDSRTWVLSEDGTLFYSRDRTGWTTVASDVTHIEMTNNGPNGAGLYVTQPTSC